MKHLAAGLLLFCWLPLWGQVTNLHFTNLSIDAGLSDKMVFAVAQDSTGLMWFGTAEGLNRYDGYNFETFRYNPGDSTSVSASFINCIHLTRTGELWIGTEKGLDLYDPVTESFVKYHADNDSLRLLNNLRIRCIHDDPQGVMWVGTLEGLIRLDLRKRYINYFVLVPDAFDRMANEIRSICADRHGMLWLGTFDGLYRFNPTDNSFVRYETRSRKLPNDTYNNLVNALYIPENTPDLLYVGSSSGLVVLDIRHPEQPLGTLRAEDGGLTDNDIKSILSYDDTHLLLATADGLTLYDTRSCQASAYYSSLSDPTSLPNNSLRTLFRDRQNIVWIGTDSGLAKLDLKRKKIDCVRLTNDRKGAERKVIVNDLLGPPDHSLWLTTNEGVLRYDSTRRDAGYTRYMADKGVSHSIAKRLIRDSHGTLWLGTNDGIDYYDAARDRFVRAEHSNQNFSLKYIYDIKEDADHDIVTNISSGLCFITPHYRPDGGISHLSYKTRLISGIINSDNCDIGYFDVDAKGNIWFAATQEGLFKYEKRNDRFIQYKVRTNDPRSLISNRIYTIHVDRKGNVWTGTDRGLCKLDPASGLFERFDNDLDLSQSIRTLTSDSRGRIWAATTNKLIMYDPVRKNKIDYDFETSEPELTFQFDSDKVEKVLYNLLSNAFKFTPDNGHIGITISLRRSDEGRFAAVEVSDTGIGVTEADREHIFEQFYQGSNPSFESIRGTGIGLMLAKDFVELHGGTLTLESAPGRGSAFTFTLPVDPAGAAPASGTADRQPEAGSAERNPKVLIVEDNEDMRNFLRINLEEQYEIYTAHDGNDGWEQIRNIYPDLVVSDVMMPGMDGFELCRRSKAELLTCHIPFLLLTAKGDEENRAEGYSAGADGYIAKPFSIKTLRTRVNSLIEQRIKLRERYRQKLLTDPSEIQIESENDKFIDTLVKAIEQNIDNSEFGIQELCEISRYSYQQVYRKVKALTGESINEFIRTVRLKRAAQYLAQSDTRISEIMYSVGFNSHSYFTKCFREHFGLSPKEYAEKHRRK